MPKRPDPTTVLQREAAGARGRDAVYGGGPRPADVTQSSAATERATWEARHKRVTFHCPLPLLEALEAEVKSSGRKKNAVIVDALEASLTRKR